MRESPRIRRLRSDLKALQRLQESSSIFEFETVGNSELPEVYLIRFYGKGLWRPDGYKDVLLREQHEVRIRLGASYPRMMPELTWRSAIFHPNISSSGVVCLGGYGTYWVPSLNLDELCVMLWDMIRYENFDIDSPYNREAALWARSQTSFTLPLDSRPLRDKIACGQNGRKGQHPPIVAAPRTEPASDVVFIDSAVVDAEIVEAEETDILFIE